MTVSTLIPMDSSKSMPTRWRISMSCGCVLMPAPRPVRSSALRSNTVTSQPACRSRFAASSPPSDPPITRARRVAMRSNAPAAGSSHRPGHAVMARLVGAVALRRIAVDQRPAIQRMGLAADLVLDREQHLARIRVDHVLEAIFVVIHLHGDQAEFLQAPIRAGEIRDIDLRVVAVIRLLRLFCLAEVPVLLLAHLYSSLAAVSVLDHRRERAHDIAIEAGDAVRGAGAHVEFDVRHPQHDTAEAVLVRRMDVDAIAPRADGLDAVVGFAEVELGPLQRLAHLR